MSRGEGGSLLERSADRDREIAPTGEDRDLEIAPTAVQRGFTLVEVLVALTIFAVLGFTVTARV
ncbi:MAG: type II secretion system protein, partial [Pseudomonadales bacterium]